MNKKELLEKLYALKYQGSYSDRDYYDKERGYEECKRKVTQLAETLDEQGLTFEAYNLFRQQTNDISAVYNELFRVQSDLFNAQKQLALHEAEKQHYERLRNEDVEAIRKEAIKELVAGIRSLPIVDGKAVSAKGFIEVAKLEEMLWENFKIELPKNS